MINENLFSVLTIPDTLVFYLNDKKGCKQKLNIYNVHDFDIKFKVCCTSVDNYNVDPPSGSIRSGCMISIRIELKNHDFDRKSDIFKIFAYSKDDKKVVGEKEIMARILPEKLIENEIESNQKNELNVEKSHKSLNDNFTKNIRKIQNFSDNPQNLVIISTGRFCFYIVLIFLFGMIIGMILNAPQDIKVD